MLGDVRFEDPLAIWNGPRLRSLREAHYSRRGTLFCRGCPQAPHLPAANGHALTRELKRSRMALAHVRNKVSRKWRERRLDPLEIHPALPPHRRYELVFAGADPPTRARPWRRSAFDLAREPATGRWWFTQDGGLWALEDRESEPRRILALPRRDRPVTCFTFFEPGLALLSFHEDGRVWRFDAAQASLEPVLELSGRRSFVRTPAVARSERGTLWLGEYAVAPGARCAHVYRSDDRGSSFKHVLHVADARHCHSLLALRDGRGVLVSTGDLPHQSRLFLAPDGERRVLQTLLSSWAGFTGMAETRDYIHLGTDLFRENALVRWKKDLRDVPEVRHLPEPYDLQVLQLISVDDQRLVALLGTDGDLLERRGGRRAALLLSLDQGATWQPAHLFEEDWSDAPEHVVVCEGPTIEALTAGAKGLLLELGNPTVAS